MPREPKPRPEMTADQIDSRNAVVVQNLGLVGREMNRLCGTSDARKGSKRFRRELRDPEDVYQSGVVGLIEAVERKPAGIALSTAAVPRIRTHAIRGACLNHRGVRFSPKVAIEIGRYRRAYRELLKSLRRRPTPEEVVRSMGLRPRPAKRVMAVIADVDRPGGLIALAPRHELDEYAGRNDPPPAFECREQLERAMAPLNETRRRVVCLRHGIGGGGDRTWNQIGEEMGFSYQRAQQLYADAMAWMRAALGVDAPARKGAA